MTPIRVWLRSCRPGQHPMADFPVVTLTGDQVDIAARDAVNDFISYVHAPEQIGAITELGSAVAVGYRPPPLRSPFR